MLNLNAIKISRRHLLVLHLFLSCIAFQTQSFADSKSHLAEKYRNEGFSHQQKGNLYEALNYYSKAISLGTENAHVYNDIGVIYEKVGLQYKAEQHYHQAIRIDKNFLPAYMNLAYFYKANGEKDKAAEFFRLRYELSEDKDDSWTERAKQELIALRPEYKRQIIRLEAEKLQKQVLHKQLIEFNKKIELSSQHFQKGQSYFKKGQFKKAIGEYERSLKITPNNPKIVNARKHAEIELSKEKLKFRSEQALKLLSSGDSYSAKFEIQKMLAEIPDEPIIISE